MISCIMVMLKGIFEEKNVGVGWRSSSTSTTKCRGKGFVKENGEES